MSEILFNFLLLSHICGTRKYKYYAWKKPIFHMEKCVFGMCLYMSVHLTSIWMIEQILLKFDIYKNLFILGQRLVNTNILVAPKRKIAVFLNNSSYSFN